MVIDTVVRQPAEANDANPAPHAATPPSSESLNFSGKAKTAYAPGVPVQIVERGSGLNPLERPRRTTISSPPESFFPLARAPFLSGSSDPERFVLVQTWDGNATPRIVRSSFASGSSVLSLIFQTWRFRISWPSQCEVPVLAADGPLEDHLAFSFGTVVWWSALGFLAITVFVLGPHFLEESIRDVGIAYDGEARPGRRAVAPSSLLHRVRLAPERSSLPPGAETTKRRC